MKVVGNSLNHKILAALMQAFFCCMCRQNNECKWLAYDSEIYVYPNQQNR